MQPYGVTTICWHEVYSTANQLVALQISALIGNTRALVCSLHLALSSYSSSCFVCSRLVGFPADQVPALASVAVISWVAAGAVLGDYAMLRDPDENPLSNAMGWPIFQAVVNAMITWAVAMVSVTSMLECPALLSRSARLQRCPRAWQHACLVFGHSPVSLVAA